MANAGIAVYGDYQDVAFSASAFEISDVSDVQRVETAVGEDDLCACAFMLGEELAETLAGDDFRCGVAHGSVGLSGCLATDGFEKFVARDRGGAALHDDEAAGDVGDVSGFQRRCAGSESESIGR